MKPNVMLKSIVAAFLICLGMWGCANTFEWKKVDGQYRNSTFNFSLALPDGWQYRAFNPNPGHFLEAQSPASKSSRGMQLANLSLHVSKTNESKPPRYPLGKNLKKTGEGTTRIGDYEAEWITYDIIMAESMSKAFQGTNLVAFVNHKVYSFVRAPWLYRITFAATDADTYCTRIVDFENTVLSLDFGE